MTSIPRAIGVGLALALLSFAAAATVPSQVHYQGLLLDDQGEPVQGSVDLVFTLYDAITGGAAVWTEAHPGVPVLDGVYDVALGQTTPITAGTVAGGAVFLEIEVDGETLTPRQQFASVPFALRSETAETTLDVGGAPAGFVGDLWADFAFDGADPPNDDPSEGLGDTDGDGLANFLDSDNDDDTILDADELAQGSDINVVTPILDAFDPDSAEASVTTHVSVSGVHFEPGLTVSFGSESPAPQNLTPTSFEVDVGPQDPGTATVLVTKPNGETASAPFDFVEHMPTITSLVPDEGISGETTNVTVNGTGFAAGLSVAFGSESPAPQNLTPTSFQVSVGPQPAGSAAVNVGYPSGNQSPDASFEFLGPVVTGFTPAFAPSDETTLVTVDGTSFAPGLEVQFGSEAPVVQNLTSTSFQVSVGPQPPGQVTVSVGYPGGDQSPDTSFVFVDPVPKTVFVSSSVSNGVLGGLSGADATCNSLAGNASLSGSYVAWLSDAVDSPATRITAQGYRWARVDGVTVADTLADLFDGTVDTTISVDENGDPHLTQVWTGTFPNGGPAVGFNCGDWTTGSSGQIGLFGNSATGASQWTHAGTTTCNQPKAIYCFEQ